MDIPTASVSGNSTEGEAAESTAPQETDTVSHKGWQNITSGCHVAQTYQHAVSTCDSSLEVLSLTSPDATPVALLANAKPDDDYWTFAQWPGSRNAYTVRKPAQNQFHIYEVKIPEPTNPLNESPTEL